MLDQLFSTKRESYILRAGFFVAMLFSTLMAEGFVKYEPPVPPPESNAPYLSIGPVLEAKAGYFFFADSKMRKIYDKGGLDLQLSLSYPVQTWPERYGLDIYASVEYLQRSGKSLGSREKTSIWEIPVSLGLKPIFAICPKVQYYFAVGPRYFYVHQHNHSSYVSKNIDRNVIGLFVNTGFNFIPCSHFLIDLFGEYSFARTHFHSKSNTYGRKVQVGGFAFGAGLGYAF